VAAAPRVCSSRGGIQVARQRVRVGFGHAGKTVTIQLGDTTLRIIDQHGELITTVPRAANWLRAAVFRLRQGGQAGCLERAA
jgi:hypothetical protein